LRKDKTPGALVEILDIAALINPFETRVDARFQHGEDLLDPEAMAKSSLCFPSGESLPRCWCDGGYRDAEVARHGLWA